MVLRSHLLAAAEFGRATASELTLAERLWPMLPEASVTVVDRGFIAYKTFHDIQTGGKDRHWLTRAKAIFKHSVVKRLGRGDQLVALPIGRDVRRAHPHLPDTLQARAIRYRRRGFRPQTLLTSLLDAKAYPAESIVELYHERWETEIVFDEIKTHTLEREEALRSRAPERIRQELWGLMIAYNLVRLEMERVAQRIGLPPSRIGYRPSLLMIRNFWLAAWQVETGNLPRRLDILHDDVALNVLPPRRPRSYPRAVKIKMSNYALKRDGLK
jgi:hypothetical protein